MASTTINANTTTRNVISGNFIECSTPVPPNCVIAPIKSRMLMPGEKARPSEGNLIKILGQQQNFKLQLQHTPIVQRKAKE
jgi:hypothetical protein